jgi:simple sugar transport system ATP-binding protein
MNADAKVALKTTGIGIDELSYVSGLPVGYMQFVEIAREIDKKNVKLLVFDEPTAVLTESEAETLMTAMKNIAKSGIAIIFITHRLDEVMDAADNITILRDGELVATVEKKNTNVVQLAEYMVGRKLEIIRKQDESVEEKEQENIIKIKDLVVDMPGERVKGVN